MKDAYSFQREHEYPADEYRNMYDAYCRIYDRLGLTFRAVQAEPGAIGGGASHAFKGAGRSGRGRHRVFLTGSDYAANVEARRGGSRARDAATRCGRRAWARLIRLRAGR